ncbi:hypothetical protein [Emergencia sp. 1XD21-10]|uniref:hypothetical protein n=1 Tax=Emergencia sp. 1XD21-10 TaxID=2304569 RepID=UPI0013798CDA|nr:hypothetical protein [Emergencia sp. 1XD21-10]NCE99988.1 hypothetical protein [Emergencia sp. 1XD21-10]
MADKVIIAIDDKVTNKTTKQLGELSKQITGIKDTVKTFGKMNVRPKVTLDNTKFLESVKDSESKLNRLEKKWVASMELSDKTSLKVRQIQSRLYNLANRNYQIKIGINSAGVLQEIGKIRRELNQPFVIGVQQSEKGFSSSGGIKFSNPIKTQDGLSSATKKWTLDSMKEEWKDLTDTASKYKSTVEKYKNLKTRFETADPASPAGRLKGVLNKVKMKFSGGVNTTSGVPMLTSEVPMVQSLEVGAPALVTSAAQTFGLALGAAGIAEGIDHIGNGILADNSYARTYEMSKGAAKIGAVGTGAAIGSAFGPLGTAVGAGVGYLAGKYLSDPIAKWAGGGKLGAMKNAAISPEAAERLEEYRQKQAELAKSKLDEKFGKITLSAKELSEVVKGLFDPAQTARINNASAAISEVETAFNTLQQNNAGFKKTLWLSSSEKLDSVEQNNLKFSADNFGEEQIAYLKDKQYADIEAVKAVAGEGESGEILIDSINEKYTEKIDEAQKLVSKLKEKTAKALEDGYIDKAEQSGLDKIIQDIEALENGTSTSDKNEDQTEKKINPFENMAVSSLKDMDWASFQNIISGGISSADEKAAVLEDAYNSVGSQFNAEERKIALWGKNGNGEEGLYAEKTNLYMDVAKTTNEEFKNRFKGELGYFGESSITEISAQMKENPYESFKKFRDQGNALRADEETRAAVGEYVDSMAGTTQKILELAKQFEAAGVAVPQEMQEYLKQMDFYAYVADDKAMNWLSDNANRKFQTDNYDYLVGAAQTPQTESSQEGGGTATVATQLQVDGEKVIDGQINITPEDFGIPKFIQAPVDVYIKGNKIVGEAPSLPQPSGNRGKLVNHKYRGGIIAPAFADGGYVHGGAQLITVAEEGTPEAIIPLGRHRRKRALELFNQVGGYLQAPGFSPKGFAAGGIVGSIGSLSGGAGGSGAPVAIEVGGVEIKVEAKDGQSLVETIRENKEAISEEIAGVFNAAFKGQFANTPAAGGAGL